MHRSPYSHPTLHLYPSLEIAYVELLRHITHAHEAPPSAEKFDNLPLVITGRWSKVLPLYRLARSLKRKRTPRCVEPLSTIPTVYSREVMKRAPAKLPRGALVNRARARQDNIFTTQQHRCQFRATFSVEETDSVTRHKSGAVVTGRKFAPATGNRLTSERRLARASRVTGLAASPRRTTTKRAVFPGDNARASVCSPCNNLAFKLGTDRVAARPHERSQVTKSLPGRRGDGVSHLRDMARYGTVGGR